MVTIGIDLGTTNCCMAYVKDNRPLIIPNQNGEFTTPSYISFIKNEVLFGKIAMKRRIQNETNTIYDVKRFIGRSYSDEHVQKFMDRWKFNLLNYKGQMNVNINTVDFKKMYTPQMLSGMLLKHLKEQAETYIGKPANKAYITVPTYFNDAQRHATIDAGKIAGFEEVKLLNEPTAAAIAYSTEHYSQDERTVFVFDFGGGTFDVSLIKFKDKNINVIAIDGDLELGGNDVTQNLVKHYAKIIRDQYNFDVFTDARKYFRFEAMCEDAKRQLSDSVEATLQILDLIPEDVELTIPRHDFDKINEDIFAKTIKIVDRCLKSSGVDIASIDDVVVVGGSTRIKKIANSLEDYFKKPLKFTINADQAVALGAAIAASKWQGNKSYSDVTFTDISPYSLGVENAGKSMSFIIPKFTPLPAKFNKKYCNSTDGQRVLRVKIFSGEEKSTENNTFLGDLTVSGFTPGPAKSIIFNVTFIYDTNGILTVEANEPSSGKKSLEISLDKGNLSESELKAAADNVAMSFNILQAKNTFKEMRQRVVDMCSQTMMKEKNSALCESYLKFAKKLNYSEKNTKELKIKYEALLKIRQSLS